MLVACMAGPLDTGQEIATHLLLHIIPLVLIHLTFLVLPEDPMSFRFLAKTIAQMSSWRLRGHPRGDHPKRLKCLKCFKKPKKKTVSKEIQDKTIKQKLPTYLVLALVASFKVGCCVEIKLHRFLRPIQWAQWFLALQGTFLDDPAVRFNSDSFSIGIDNHASRCMANAPHLFEDLHLIDNAGEVNGIGEGLAIKEKGTFVFSLKDDNGQIHTIKIPNSLYLPGLKQCLLSPQHWAQEAGDGQTWMGNFARQCVLKWHGGGKKTVFFNPSTNTPIFTTAPSSRAYRAFATTFKALEAPYYRKETVLQYPGRHLMDDEPAFAPEEFVAEENLNFEKEVSVAEGVKTDDEMVKTSNLPAPPDDDLPSEAIRHGPLTFDPSPPPEEGEDVQLAAADDQAELMRWHYRLGHLTFAKLKQLALNGEIPKKLATVTPPKCAGCLFGAMTKIPWRGKETKASREVFIATKPGECISIDQMASTEVGFFAQMKGKLTKKCYRCATIFVDHFSRLRFVHLQIDDSSAETLTAKRAFETFAAEHGVRIQHYHCNNGRFYDNAFKQACHDARQQLTFCGINAHFQNGIAERSIRDLSESTRKQLLHSRARWPQAVHFALWPYALRNAALLHNSLPVLEDDTSRLELFSSIRVGSNMKHVHTFGCPVFALQNALASGKSLPRWSPRARLGLNLGPSPVHARNVYLVLNLTTGCVSPQYHCRFDDFFETTRHGGPDVSGTISWQQIAGLDRASMILSEMSAPIQRSAMYPESLSEGDVPPEEPTFSPPEFRCHFGRFQRH